jgi:xanthine dehydrogenase accessory factor
VDVAWAVETAGFAGHDRTEALAITPGGGRVGSLLSGALDDQLADLAAVGGGGRSVDLHVGELEALVAGLPGEVDARCLLVPATDLPPELWPLLSAREPVCLVTRLDGGRVVDAEVFTTATVGAAGDEVVRAFERKRGLALVTEERVVTVLWPVPRLVIVGAGPIADALRDAAALLGWHTQVVLDAQTATGVVADLAGLDQLVVLGHDLELVGRALVAALDSDVGYIGALGSRQMQETRADWLAYRGVTDVDRIHGPAGLDIGASSPAEIAISILAEALAVRSGSTLVANQPSK